MHTHPPTHTYIHCIFRWCQQEGFLLCATLDSLGEKFSELKQGKAQGGEGSPPIKKTLIHNREKFMGTPRLIMPPATDCYHMQYLGQYPSMCINKKIIIIENPLITFTKHDWNMLMSYI